MVGSNIVDRIKKDLDTKTDHIRLTLELKALFDGMGYDRVEGIFIESKKWLDHEFRKGRANK